MSAIDIARRFGGVTRLYGEDGLRRLQQAHVVVVGIGGVGSWAVEALARNAVGRMTLIDLDNVAESNVNRQLHAVDDNFGKAKVSAMATRVHQINPQAIVHQVEDFITADNVATTMAEINLHPIDVVLDCADDAKAKVALAALCVQQSWPLFVSGSAGGRLDPTRIQLDDLAMVKGDKLLAKVRQQLRKHHGFSKAIKQKKPKRMGVNCIYSNEPVIKPTEVCETGDDVSAVTGLNCAGYGSSVAVTAPFGFALAQNAINAMLLS